MDRKRIERFCFVCVRKDNHTKKLGQIIKEMSWNNAIELALKWNHLNDNFDLLVIPYKWI